MRKNKTSKIVAFALLLAIIALILVSSTYAKYTTTISGTDTAVVAKWNVSSGYDTTTFGLFDTINDTKGGKTEDDVKTGLIAPGTQGSFKVVLKNDSEVTSDYEVTLVQSNKNIPIQYNFGGDTWYTAAQLETDVVKNLLKGTLAFKESSKVTEATPTSKEITISWKWDYYVDADHDDADKALAGTTPAQTDVTISTVFTQVD